MNDRALEMRWEHKNFDLRTNSPFGITTNGYQDFRGIKVKWDKKNKTRPELKIDANKSDYSFSCFESVDFANCSFDNCNFSSANFTHSYLSKTTFDNCDFTRARFSGHGERYVEACFKSCNFDETVVREVEFFRTKFLNVDILGDTWTSVEFKETQFEKCALKGLFVDCRFWGLDPLQDKKFQQLVQRGSFVDCDLRQSDFAFVDFLCEFEFKNVQLPSPAVMILISNENLRLCSKKFKSDTEGSQDCTAALDVFGGDFMDHQIGYQILFAKSFNMHFGEQVGQDIYEKLIIKSEQLRDNVSIILGNL
jgi:fluoroquinolone resistance protein